MFTSIVKATRAHYAALQQRKAPDRIALDYKVTREDKNAWVLITSGTVWVKANTGGQRKAQFTRLVNRLQVMFPEATHFEAEYRREP